MNHRILKIWAASCCAILLLSACTKIDSTKLGSELIPAVDNVNTFETVMEVVANNYLDTMVFSLNSSNPHMVGAISQDPVFGTSTSTMFFQMSPSSYPFKFPADSIRGNSKVGFDSAVLILDYIGYYGDSSQPVSFKLYGVDSVMQPDLSLYPRYTLNPNLNADKSVFWGSKTMNALQFRDTSLVIRKADTSKVTRQLRIRLDSAMARQLLLADSNEVYANDTLYRSYLKGFSLEAEGLVNTLFYFSLQGNSKIEFFYRKNPLSPTQDTTSTTFTVSSKSGHAAKFENNHGGTELSAHLIPDPVNGKKDIYIQSSPGTYATLRIPGLDTFRNVNRIIHRAELRVVQSEERLDYPQLVAPQALYLDIIDTINNTFRGVPYDLNPVGLYYCYPGSGVNFGYFGGIASEENINGKKLNVYRFNISRYLQGVLSKGEQLFPLLRLSAPFYMFYKECANGGASYPQQIFPFVQGGTLLVPPGFGRIKLAGGEKAGVEPARRMQLRIIYSTL